MFNTTQFNGNSIYNGETGHQDNTTQFIGNRTDNNETGHQDIKSNITQLRNNLFHKDGNAHLVDTSNTIQFVDTATEPDVNTNPSQSVKSDPYTIPQWLEKLQLSPLAVSFQL